MADDDLVIVGKISSPYGIKGWVKIHSYTDPVTNILDYAPWYLSVDDGWQKVEVLQGRPHGKTVVAHLAAVANPEEAVKLRGKSIAVEISQLPQPAAGEYYWSELEGLRVVNLEGVELGVVDHLFETGANDVLVVVGERERLLPYVMEHTVKSVDLEQGLITVDWDADF